MEYPLDELIDKRSIIQLKLERIHDSEADKDALRKEFYDYSKAIKDYIKMGVCTAGQTEEWHNELYEANARTWDLETNIRRGQIGDMGLEEIGRTAIKIRENNGIRVGIKSRIVEETGRGYKDVKMNHASFKTIEKGYRSTP